MVMQLFLMLSGLVGAGSCDSMSRANRSKPGCANLMTAISEAENRLTGISGRADAAGERARALEWKVAEALRGHKENECYGIR